MRSLPFFGTSFGYLAAFSLLSRQFAALESLTEYAVQSCHDYDFEQLQAQLRAWRDGAFDDLLRCRQARLMRLPANFPAGYTRMAIAVIEVRQTGSFKDAEQILREVPVTPEDFPWLEDIRMLATAAAAHRFGDEETERRLSEGFLERQPMLFEPDHALNFLLLEYQERLKPRALRSLNSEADAAGPVT
jgi:hypothetical protein